MNIHYNDELIQPIRQADPDLRNDTRLLHYAELAELFVQTFEVYYELAADRNVSDTHIQNTKNLVRFIGNMLSGIDI
ncbi:hypothetical protein DNHGIG_00770 [Collibacillus ludicampi]|uniref:Uncharacterized protein n=1 Tax=Collibacillus ludicampi TaxID=2771369 RepID=A0AAV4L9S1_9BACL|nr:hypothetical protein [Collibacillus ludicampi]GIM44528.1 hypothetical protein DNHGIG_00770 [Collibacillus ludicampi]